MRHVITGGSGFTAAYLCQALFARGVRPVLFDQRPCPSQISPDVDYVAGDIRSADDLARLDLREGDAVYHLAARIYDETVPKRGRDQWFADVNVDGTERVLDAMEAGGAKHLIFFSTDMTYGPPDRTPVDPSHPQRPVGPYGQSKLDAERAIFRRAAQSSLNATVFRPRMIAGAGRLGILTKLFRLIAIGAPVPMIGSGRNRYQMIAAEDCAAAALRAFEAGCPTGAFNLGSEDPPTVRELLRELIDRAGSRSILVSTPAKLLRVVLNGFDQAGFPLLYREQFAIADLDYVLDTADTEARFGWKPTRRDADILSEAYTQYRQNSRGVVNC